MKPGTKWLLAALMAAGVAMGATVIYAEDVAEKDQGKTPETEEIESSNVTRATAEGYSRSKMMAKRYAMGIVKRETKRGHYRIVKVEYTYHSSHHRKWTCTVTYEYWD